MFIRKKSLFTPKAMPIARILNTSIESHIILTQTRIIYFISFTEYERKYIDDTI